MEIVNNIDNKYVPIYDIDENEFFFFGDSIYLKLCSEMDNLVFFWDYDSYSVSSNILKYFLDNPKTTVNSVSLKLFNACNYVNAYNLTKGCFEQIKNVKVLPVTGKLVIE